MLERMAATARNYPALFLALDDLLEALQDGRPDEDALRRSFEGSADGFGAAKALLLAVDARSGRLRAVTSRRLSAAEVSACESGRSVPGVSSSCIRRALDRGAPVLVQDPEHAGGDVSEAIRHRPCSVLTAPVRDPRTGTARFVLYVQNEGVGNAFGEIDRAWIEVYARALGRVLTPRHSARPDGLAEEDEP